MLMELAANGFDYVTLDSHGGRLSGSVREEDVRKFFTGFEVDKVRLRSCSVSRWCESLCHCLRLSLTATLAFPLVFVVSCLIL